MTRVAVAIAALLLAGCFSATVSRIGPPVPPRNPDCDIEVLAPGQRPSRPYRDVGMVTLENCQDYMTPPCLGRLEKAACGLGGAVAYFDEDQKPAADIVAPMTYRVLVAAYVADLVSGEDDPVLGSKKSADCDEAFEHGSDEVMMDKCVE